MNMKNVTTHTGKRLFQIAVCGALLFASSCANVIHELIPPADSNIHSFSVEDGNRSRYAAESSDSTEIVITVPANTDVTSLLPVIESGDKSTVLPVTLPYIHRAFPSADLMSLALQMNASLKSDELGDWVLNFIRENSSDFSVPPIDEPVDFTQPVPFCVIAGQGNYKVYTVTVIKEKTENPSQPDNPSPSNPDEPDEPQNPDEPSVPSVTETEKNILSFAVNEPKQTKPSVIGNSTVDFTMNAGTDVSALYPVITVSEGAGILPLTQDYLLRLFSYTEMISVYSGYSTAKNVVAFLSATVKKLDDAKIAKIMENDLSLPIDFSGFLGLVPFAIIGADKTVKLYLVFCSSDEDTAALTSFAITKIRNPGLMGDAEVNISENTITATVTSPVEYPNFSLIPDIVIEGDTWEISCGTLTTQSVADSGADAEYAAGLKNPVKLVPNDTYPIGKEYTATITVKRGSVAVPYTLTLIYKEDPDTIRSITDFRFLKLRNPGIRTTAMASISKTEDTGFISATVLYDGEEPPYNLVADFYSPGICTVEHVTQVSGETENNYQRNLRILCTSKNGLFCRLYTVQVTFIKIKNAHAALNYFALPSHLNPDLSQSAEGLIDEGSGTVYITAKYHTPQKPSRLIPEFAAAGSVTVNSILQSSGYSVQDFSRSVYYAVRDVNDWSADSKMYRISINWERDEQSACAITTFGFAQLDNSTLSDDVTARISERDGTVYALLPKDAQRNALAAYFTARGTVSINGIPQTSGVSVNDFSEPVTYTVTSANGLYTKDYTVSVQEAGPVIYVNADAIGRNNGTCWEDAYITLDAAFAQAEAYGEANKEIWIAHCNGRAYTPLSPDNKTAGLPLVSNTIIRGGFDGTETSEKDRKKTKEHKIEFSVNAKEKKEISHSANVCDIQTKLSQPDDGKDSHLFRADTLTGEIVFDGVELEQKDSYDSCLLGIAGADESSFTFSDCTVRSDNITLKKCGDVVIENSDLYNQYLAAETIQAEGTRFKNTSRLRLLTDENSKSLSLESCVFSNEEASSFQIKFQGIADIDSCFFDDSTELYLDKQCDIANSTIKARSLDFSENSKFSVINSSFYTTSFTKIEQSVDITMTASTMTETGGTLFNSSTDSINAHLTNCKFVDSQSTSADDYYINGVDNIEITGCTFDIKNGILSKLGSGLAKISNSTFNLDESFNKDNKATAIRANGIVEFTGNTIKSDSKISVYFCKDSADTDSTIFSRNKLYGRWVDLTAYKLKGFGQNEYHNYVKYYLSPFYAGSSIDFNTEKIEIKKPLYNREGKPCTKKAYLCLYDVEISIDKNSFSKDEDFLCHLSVRSKDEKNCNSIVKVKDLTLLDSDQPLYADENRSQRIDYDFGPLSVKGEYLELANCTLECTGNNSALNIECFEAKIKNCTLKSPYSFGTCMGGNVTIEDSTIDATIREVIYPTMKSHVVLKNSTCGMLDDITIIEAEHTKISAFGNTNFPEFGYSISGGYKTKSITLKDTYCEGDFYCSGSAEAILEGTTVDGNIYFGDTLTTKAYNGSPTEIYSVKSAYEASSLSLSDTNFNGKGTAQRAIDVSGKAAGTVSIINCNFSNYASDDYIKSPNLYIQHMQDITINTCTFKNLKNESRYTNDGANLYISDVPSITIENSSFEENSVKYNGMVQVYNYKKEGSITISNSKFINNTLNGCADISAYNTTLIINNCTPKKPSVSCATVIIDGEEQ